MTAQPDLLNAQPLTFALVKCAKNTAAENMEGDWHSWCERLTCFDIRQDKDGAGFIPARMKVPTRKAGNVDAYTALVLDIEPQGDTTPPTPEEAAARLATAGLAGIVYTSHNHMATPEQNKGKPSAPRYRVVTPLAHDMPPTVEHLQANIRGLAGRLGLLDCIDLGSKDRSRFFYLPSHRPNAPHFAQAVQGQWWQPIEPPAPAQPERPARKANHSTRPHAAPALDTTDSEWRRHTAAVFAITGDALDDRDTWLRVGMALHSTDDGRAFALWCEWAGQSPKFDAADARRVWDSFTEKRMSEEPAVTMASVHAMAKDRGAKLEPLAATNPPPAGFGDAVDTLLQQAETDIGALWEPDALAAIRALYDKSPAQWARLRVRLKAIKDLKLSDYEKAIVPTGDKEAEQNHAAMLITLAAEHCQFIHDADMTGYALLSTNDVRQCHRLDSTAFGEWLSYQFYKAEGTAPSDYALKAAIASMTGKAKFEGDLHEVHTRIARHDGAYWLDLCNDQWQAVRITRDGWQVIDRPPVLFTRSANMRPLPTPQAGQGDITALWHAVNVLETERLNVLAWLIECLRPETPFVVLELSGEHGSAKSGTARVLRDLIDPNKSNLRAAPKSRDDLFVVARNAHVLCLENLSHLSSEYQDALCTLATGGGYAARTLYTNGEETCFEIKKPIILNGIPSVVTASDLSSRTLHMELPVIKQGRMTEEEIKAYWQAHQAIAFAGLLDTFAQVLAELERVQHDRKALGELPRMADFCLLGEAVYRVHGLPAGAFIAYDRARIAESAQRTLEGSPVAMAMIEWLKANPTGYEGTVKGLLEQLDRLCLDTPASAWPKSPKGLGDIIQRVKPALRLIGIELHKEAKNRRDGVWCTLRYAPKDNPKPQQAAAKGAVGELGELGELCPPTANTTQKQAANPCQTGGCELGELGELENKPFAPEHTYTPPAPAKTANGYALNSGFGSHAATTSKPEGWEGDL